MKRAKSGLGNKIVLAVLAVFIFCAVTAVVSAAPICNLTKIVPDNLEANTTDTFIAVINCTDPAGINISRFMLTRTVEGFQQIGLPNLWSIRPPVNDHAQSNGTIPQILLADARGMSKWYDSEVFTDNYSYAASAYDGPLTNPYVNVTNGSTWALFNLTWKVEPVAFRSSLFLSRGYMEKEVKKNYEVYEDNPLLVKFWDLEQMRDTSNCTVCAFKNINYTGNPSSPLKAYYCNSSYDLEYHELPSGFNMTGNVLLMHLNETSGTIIDSSGEGNDGTNHDAVCGTPGKFNTSLCFNNTDYVAIPNSNSLNISGDEITISTWVKWNTDPYEWANKSWANKWAQIINKNNDREWQLQHNQMNTRFEFACNGGTSRRYVWSDTRPEQGKWYHVVGVYDGVNIKLYINGEDDTYRTKSLSGNIPVSDSAVTLGSRVRGDRHINASIDELAIWNRNLSASEIKALYEKGVIAPEHSPNCVYMTSLYQSDLDDLEYTSRNSSYSKTRYSITNSTIGGINATDTYYIYYYSDTNAANQYTIRYANGTSGTNVSFADSKVAWSSTDDAATFTQTQFTPDLWFSAINNGDRFQLGVYVENSTGANYTNFSFYTDDIGHVNDPISVPSIQTYYNSDWQDKGLTGNYSGFMYVRVLVSKDPDNVSAVSHNLSLYTNESVYVKTLNASFHSPDDTDMNIPFNTSNVSDGSYKMKVIATADDNPSDVESFITPENFTIDNTAPLLTVTTTNNTVVNTPITVITGTAFDVNADEIQSNDSNWIWNGSYTSWNFTNLTTIAVGTHSILITALDFAGNNNSSLFVFTYTPLTVCADGCGYTTIQAAVNAADAGDTVYVYNGTYNENVDLSNASITLEGEGRDVVNVTAASSGDHVFEVTADYVNISGFHVSGATDSGTAGIYLHSTVEHCNISYNRASSNYYGFWLNESSRNNISRSIANTNNNSGIYLYNASNNSITCNWLYNNTRAGFNLTGGSIGNNISHNNIVENGALNDTIREWQFYNDQIDPVTATHNWWGTNENSTINASIYDWDIDNTKGNVTVFPRLYQPDPCAPIPELSTVILVGVGLVMLSGYVRIRRRRR